MFSKDILRLIEISDYEQLEKLGYGTWTKEGFYLHDYGIIGGWEFPEDIPVTERLEEYKRRLEAI